MNKLLYFCFIIGGLLSCSPPSNTTTDETVIDSIVEVHGGVLLQDYLIYKYIDNNILKLDWTDRGGGDVKIEVNDTTHRIVELRITNIPYGIYASQLQKLQGLKALYLTNTHIENLSLLEPLVSSLRRLSLYREHLIDDTLVLSDKWKNLEYLRVFSDRFRHVVFPKDSKLKRLYLEQERNNPIVHHLDTSFWILKELEDLTLDLGLDRPFTKKGLKYFPKLEANYK